MTRTAPHLASREELQRSAQSGKLLKAAGGQEKEIIRKEPIVSGKVTLRRTGEFNQRIVSSC